MLYTKITIKRSGNSLVCRLGNLVICDDTCIAVFSMCEENKTKAWYMCSKQLIIVVQSAKALSSISGLLSSYNIIVEVSSPEYK